MSETVNLIENFVSWQGEGPDSGQAMIILRFKTCNLKCPWCDTSVKMRISAEAPYKLSDIQETINQTRSGILITGGEPTVDRHLKDTISLLNNLDYPIANVESNGYKLGAMTSAINPNKPVHYIYSPKIFSMDDTQDAIYNTTQLLNIPNLFIKVVYEDREYIIRYLEWLSRYIDNNDSNRVWLMPEGITREQLIKNSEEVFNACERYRFNFSSRNHIIYGFV